MKRVDDAAKASDVAGADWGGLAAKVVVEGNLKVACGACEEEAPFPLVLKIEVVGCCRFAVAVPGAESPKRFDTFGALPGWFSDCGGVSSEPTPVGRITG